MADLLKWFHDFVYILDGILKATELLQNNYFKKFVQLSVTHL